MHAFAPEVIPDLSLVSDRVKLPPRRTGASPLPSDAMTIFSSNGAKIFWIGLFLVVAMFVVVILSPFLPIGGPFGRWAARRDIARDHFQLTLPPSNAGWQTEAGKTLKEKYRIEIVFRPTSNSPDGIIGSYESAYNKTQQEAILAKFGRDVVRQTLLEAQKNAAATGTESPSPGLRRIESQLAKFKDGDPVSELEKALALSQYISTPTPNLPLGEEHIIYTLPEGELHVMTKTNRRGKTTLSPAPFLIANESPTALPTPEEKTAP